MRNLLLRCPKCSGYTMAVTCVKCGETTVMAAPAKYSPDDKYARYRSPQAYETPVAQDR
jgi:H/ACA ribonucleoprotein complex subunit 3